MIKTFNEAILVIKDDLNVACLTSPLLNSEDSKEDLVDEVSKTLKMIARQIKGEMEEKASVLWTYLAIEGMAGLCQLTKKSPEVELLRTTNLVVSKQHDYGPSNIVDSPFGAQTGLVVRLYDKVARLKNLTKKGVTPKNESIEDTWRDIVGYAIIGIMVEKDVFLYPLE